ncbi:unnamed protein product, partial [Ilex paraguariensis]
EIRHESGPGWDGPGMRDLRIHVGSWYIKERETRKESGPGWDGPGKRELRTH